MNILIVKLSAIGDVIHTLPAANALRRRYPEARIAWLVEEAASPLVEGHAALDRVLISRRKTWIKALGRPGERTSAAREMAAFIRDLRDTRYDLIIDFHQLLKSALLVAAARGRFKAGFDRGMDHMEESFRFLNVRIPAVGMEHHALDRNLMLLASLGIPSGPAAYRLPVTPEDRDAASGLLEPLAGRPFVAVNPVAQWDTKLWAPDRFGALADRLADAFGVEIVFTGGPGDREAVRAIGSVMKRPFLDLAGRTSLRVLAAVYERTRLAVTTDTGPMHLAAAAGAPVAAVFGPTAPWRTGPYGSGHRVIRAGVSCSPCFKRTCPVGDHRCMDRIAVADVFSAVERMGALRPRRG